MEVKKQDTDILCKGSASQAYHVLVPVKLCTELRSFLGSPDFWFGRGQSVRSQK